jgi:hypothetical protein
MDALVAYLQMLGTLVDVNAPPRRKAGQGEGPMSTPPTTCCATSPTAGGWLAMMRALPRACRLAFRPGAERQ